MEISAEKAKLMTNNISDINTEILFIILQDSTDNSSIDKVQTSLE